MVSNIPNQWKQISFKDSIKDIIDYRGRTPKKLGMEWGGGEIPALSANNVKMGKIDFSLECNMGSQKLYEKWMSKKELSKGDVLMTMEAPLGNVGQVPDNKKYILSQRVVALKTQDSIDNTYFKYFLMSPKFQSLLDRFSTGTTAKGISQKNLNKLNVLVPPFKEQIKIADILSIVDEAIEKTEAIIEQTEKVKKGLMQQLLTRGIGHTRFKKTEIGEIPEEWEVKKLNDLVEKIVGGGTPSRKVAKYYTGNIPWITVKDLKYFKLSSSLEYITEEAIENSAANLIPKGNIIVATRMAVGKAFTNLVDVAINQDLKALVPDKKLISTEFLLWSYLNKSAQIERLGTGTTVKGIRLEQLKELKFATPSLTEQEKVVEILNNFENKLEVNKCTLQRFQTLKKGLMQVLLTGEVRVKVDDE
ncbi:restriction endonuclease subunit S [Bacillus shivajii]|uniref:restriction endonuclease subunit S n=1 Tax=Bacillus shivajii TaxID=1983719 RepID=UPI001CFBC0E8|nr:restriction endonuclease subunit S [Bacillus shivajii]UCZ53463.1 restriction endonuclease subunit S [Bacillus shivajii]